jgi:hypothetical protein
MYIAVDAVVLTLPCSLSHLRPPHSLILALHKQEPELNKAMVLLLARCWEYKLKTEDVLELTQVNESF